MMEPEQPRRKPKCPKCGQEMSLQSARSHYYWLCSHHFFPVQLGIKGQDANFQFKRLVDPVTLEILDNPYFESRNKHRVRSPQNSDTKRTAP